MKKKKTLKASNSGFGGGVMYYDPDGQSTDSRPSTANKGSKYSKVV